MFGPAWFIWFFILLFSIISNRFDTHTEFVRHKRVFVWLWWMLSVVAFGFFAFVLNETISTPQALIFTFIIIAFPLISATTYYCRYMKCMHIYVPIIPLILYFCALIKHMPFSNDIFSISLFGALALFAIFYKIAMIYHAKDVKIMAQEAEDKMIKDIERKERMEELKKKGLISEDYDVQ